MLKFITAFATILTFTFTNLSFVDATTSAVLMKFTDKTQFYESGCADILSDLILEKLIASGKFRLKENYPIDISAERKLYEKNAAEQDNAAVAMETNNLDVLFSGEGFNQNKASNIDTAVTGQIVQPELTRAIGEKNGVEYLVQGTLENIGIGTTEDDTIGKNAAILARSGRKISKIGELLENAIIEQKFLGVAVSMRIIEANTGKVVWDKKIVGYSYVENIKNDKINIENEKWQEETFHKALDKAAKNIVKAMIKDKNSQKFF
jgi:hypothetical protein